MKKLKSVLAILLALVLTLALFSGCGGNQNTPSSSPAPGSPADASAGSAAPAGEPQKVIMYMLSFNRIPDDYSKVMNAVNDYIAKTYPTANVQLDMKLLGIAEYQEKVTMALQSGTPMDIFVPLGLQQAIAQNQTADITAAVEQYGKEMTEILKKDFSSDPYAVTSKDGKIYGVPVNKAYVLSPTFIFDKDIFAKTGLSKDDIKSIWDLDKVFAVVKEQNPDIYPYSTINAAESVIQMIINYEQKIDMLGSSYLGNSIIPGVAIGSDPKVVNLYSTDIYKKYIDLMHSWYEKGYMPMDVSTSTAQATELMKAGRLFSTYGGYADGTGGPTVGTLWSFLLGKNIDGKQIATPYVDTSATSLAMCVSSKSANPEAAVKFLNILYTDEFVINTLLYGIEGEDYVKVSEHVIALPEGLTPDTVGYTAALTSGVMGSNSLMWVNTSEEDYASVQKAIAMNATSEKSPFFGFVFDPTNVMNEMTALSNVASQYLPGLQCGSSDPAEVLPQFIKALEDAGIDKVIAEKQTQLDAWIKANK
ncbi:MAG: ABC transporter substrate-binding protein [Clostridiales bacterium]|nr:ABC transporter substrate-binding protein [Clostridiales bacterium]